MIFSSFNLGHWRYSTRFNNISIQATAPMAADMEAVGLS